MYLLGYDIGSSSVKAALVHLGTGQTQAFSHYPDTEMPIHAPQSGWAEQHPEDWWTAVIHVTQRLLQQTGVRGLQIQAIGLAYQMHGLVLLDKQSQVLRPAIIWCDSRAVSIGERALKELGTDYCMGHCFNSPGNFTASKLRWVQEHEPAVFDQIHHFMLPGDYIAYRMTGEIGTTITGLSEGILWDFKSHTPAYRLLSHYGIPESMLPPLMPVFGEQGRLTQAAADCLGLPKGIPVTYRAGDQPNNAMSLQVLHHGEVAATGGTSGVVYAVSERPVLDPQQRVNGFAHVNYSASKPLMGVLLCINGAGIQYSWLRKILSDGGAPPDYSILECLAASAPTGADGLSILPFGNGSERMLGNRDIGSHFMGLQLNRHGERHLYRATLEGIAFAFALGMQALKHIGIHIHTLRVGNDNLFRSRIVGKTLATLMDAEINVLQTSGAEGAAYAAGVGMGIFSLPEEVLGIGKKKSIVATYVPDKSADAYHAAYGRWTEYLSQQMGRS